MLRVTGAVARAPAVHFLALGAVLFALNTRIIGPAAASTRAPILITAARVAEIRDDYRRNVADPTPAELDALVAREAEEEMLYREALLLGLDRGDRAVQWRVIEKVHFLFGDEIGDPAEAYRRGIALGLQRDDVVVRNTLVTKMRLLAKAASRNEEPSGAAFEHDLDAYLQSHRDAYAQPERLSLTQVFLSRDKHGATLEAHARALSMQLRASQTSPEAASRMGDPFFSGSVFRNVSRADLVKFFGDAFTARVADLAPRQWSDPVLSPYGLHLVWITARDGVQVPALDVVRPRVLRAYRAERRAQYLARMVDELRTAYEVRVEHDQTASR